MLTLYKNGLCVLPYRSIKKSYLIKIIIKLIIKLKCNVVLSNYLETTILKEELKKENIKILEGKELFHYLVLDILEYISKMKNEDLNKQEVTILVNKLDKKKEQDILKIAQNVKRLQIVTNNITSLQKIENYLKNELGIAIMISNNKRKSLAKSKIILNLDYSKEMLNKFTINRSAIVINVLEKVEILAKGFDGINILDYEILYKGYEENRLIFHNQSIYESKIINKKDSEIQYLLIENHVRIVNLKGKNGIINSKEYIRF